VTTPILHVSQLAAALGLPEAQSKKSTQVAWETIPVLRSWLDHLRGLDRPIQPKHCAYRMRGNVADSCLQSQRGARTVGVQALLVARESCKQLRQRRRSLTDLKQTNRQAIAIDDLLLGVLQPHLARSVAELAREANACPHWDSFAAVPAAHGDQKVTNSGLERVVHRCANGLVHRPIIVVGASVPHTLAENAPT
jgi:hypothetical protein